MTLRRSLAAALLALVNISALAPSASATTTARKCSGWVQVSTRKMYLQTCEWITNPGTSRAAYSATAYVKNQSGYRVNLTQEVFYQEYAKPGSSTFHVLGHMSTNGCCYVSSGGGTLVWEHVGNIHIARHGRFRTYWPVHLLITGDAYYKRVRSTLNY